MAQQEAGSTHLQRNPSTNRGAGAGLLRTVSQKMRSFLSSPPASKTGSCGNLLLDHLAECRCRVTPEAGAEKVQAAENLKLTSNSATTNCNTAIKLSKSSSSRRWMFRFSAGGDRFKPGMDSRRMPLPEPSGCFGFDTRCFGSHRSEESNEVSREDSEVSAVQLPDDLMEMCLARLPFDSLVRAGAVCRKWKLLTQSAHFLQLREMQRRSSDPWLFLLGLSRDGVCSGQIQALDPALDKWHTIPAGPLSGRLLYSAASFGTKIFVVGGCSARPSGDKGGLLKTHTSVLLLEPLTGQWNRISSMKSPRTTPVVATFAMKHRLGLFTSARVKHQQQHHKQEIGVFNPGMISTSRSLNFKLIEIMGRRCLHRAPGEQELLDAYRELQDTVKRSNASADPPSSRFGLIVVGGQGEWNETLYSGEVYDSELDSWREIAPWPAELGAISTGVVMSLVFYAYTDADKLLAYDLEQNSWRVIRVSSVLTQLHEYLPRLVVCDGRVLLLGVTWDTRESKAARKVWRLEEFLGGEQKWVQVSQHPDAPLDWNAVFVGHRDRIYGVEMFRIFGQVLDFVTVLHRPGEGIASWERASRRRMAQEMDASCCITKTAVVLQL